MQKATRLSFLNKKYLIAISGLAVAIIVLLGLGINAAIYKRAIKRAENLVAKGYSSVALEELSCYRKRMTKTERGCALYISAAFHARDVEKLQWASQKCIESGIDIPEATIGQAAAFEFTGREQEALQLLNNSLKKFEKVPGVHFRIATILRRQNNTESAVAAFLAASRLAPKNQDILVESLSYLISVSKWKEAREVADFLRTVETDNPALKLLIARALKQGGDPIGAHNLVEQAKQLLKDRPPETKAAIEKAFSDVITESKVEIKN